MSLAAHFFDETYEKYTICFRLYTSDYISYALPINIMLIMLVTEDSKCGGTLVAANCAPL